jgi:1-acyl-sn-glycerol-3-phosphate acyltransferase
LRSALQGALVPLAPLRYPCRVTRVLSPVRLILGFMLIAVTATLTFLIALPLLPWRALRIKLCNYYGKTVGYAIVRLSGSTLRVTDKHRLDASFPAIYVANHTSLLDAFLSIWLCPVGGCGVVKKEVVRVPFFGQLYQLSGHLMLDRGHHDKAVAALTETAALVRKHRLGIWIMPEGTRSRDARLLPFKTGFVHMAIATGLPVVPVIFEGVHRVWPRGSLRITPSPITIRVLEPIRTDTWQSETAHAHAQQVRDLMLEALGQGAASHQAA